MIKCININLDPITLTSITKNSFNKENLLYDDLEKHKQNLIGLLDGYIYKDTRGNVYDLTIEKETVVVDIHGNGGFIVLFDVHYYFGCIDQNKIDEEQMYMTININLSTGVAKICGEDIQEREPDEY